MVCFGYPEHHKNPVLNMNPDPGGYETLMTNLRFNYLFKFECKNVSNDLFWFYLYLYYTDNKEHG